MKISTRKVPVVNKYVSNLRDTCPWGYSWFEFQQGKGLNLQSTAAMDSLNAILVDGALFDEVVSFWWDGRSLDEFSRFLFMLARAHEPHQRSPRLSACFWIRPPHSHNYHELRWTFFLSLFLSLLPFRKLISYRITSAPRTKRSHVISRG